MKHELTHGDIVTPRERVEWRDIDFVAHVWLINKAVMGFEVFAIAYEDQDGGIGFECAGISSEDRTTDDIAKAYTFASGDVRFDGCSNVWFDEQERCAVHTCSRRDLENIGTMLTRVHGLASERIAGWCGI